MYVVVGQLLFSCFSSSTQFKANYSVSMRDFVLCFSLFWTKQCLCRKKCMPQQFQTVIELYRSFLMNNMCKLLHSLFTRGCISSKHLITVLVPRVLLKSMEKKAFTNCSGVKMSPYVFVISASMKNWNLIDHTSYSGKYIKANTIHRSYDYFQCSTKATAKSALQVGLRIIYQMCHEHYQIFGGSWSVMKIFSCLFHSWHAWFLLACQYYAVSIYLTYHCVDYVMLFVYLLWFWSQFKSKRLRDA